LKQLGDFFDKIVKVKKTDQIPMVLVGTMCDLKKRAVPRKVAKNMARKYNCPYIEASAVKAPLY
jgi:hypothetical protein